MELILERKFKKANYIIGNLFLKPSNTAEQALALTGEQGEGLQWICNTLEPAKGDAKETVTAGSGKAIFEGTYEVRMTWSPKFQEKLPMLMNVPGRVGIFIHAGNTPHDTTGCILVGKNTKVGRVVDSRKTLNTILSKISNDEEVKITIK